MITGENKYKWAHEQIDVEKDSDANRFEVIRIGTDNDVEMIFVPIPAFLAILKVCKEKYPYFLKDENE